MKVQKEEKIEKHEFAIYISAIVAVVFLLLDGLLGMQGVRNIISFVSQPAAFQANSAGYMVGEYLETFSQLGKFRNEYNNLKVQMYDMESKFANYMVLVNENEALKEQVALGKTDSVYVMAGVPRDDELTTILIDKGSNDGIQVGDPVLRGSTFLGIVSEVDAKGSMVRLPTDPSSKLEVVVLKSGENATTNILSKGVVTGSAEGILVENIAMNSQVENGDVVYVNDAKVGGFWALGYIVGLSQNPANTYKTAYVSPVLDYDTLMNVFVKID